MRYRPAFDGLRAIAVLSVIAYHTGWLPFGHRGVDLFFVLSGFLITRLLLAEREATGRVSLRGFYARRALRLLPARVPVLVICGVAMLAYAPTARTIVFLSSIAFYGGNWTIAQGWFASPLDHTWSLALEEQFYLLWPATLLGLVGIMSRRRVAVGLGILAVAGGLLRLDPQPLAAAIGALLSHPLVIGCALGASTLTADWLDRSWLSARPLVWIGRRSYGLYLWHFPVIFFIVGPVSVIRPSSAQALLAWAVAFGLASASFRFLERPALALKSRAMLPEFPSAWIIPLGVFAITAVVFARTAWFSFLSSWDDGAMLLDNANLLEWNWRFILTSITFGHWMPLTWLTWTIDAHLWGAWAGPWHLENALLHAISAALLYLVAFRLIWHRLGALVAALVWALHPLRIESVAWASERKDCLSGVFVLLAILLYLRAVDRGRFPWLSLACFALACTAKSISVVVVPFVLLLDWAVLDRWAWKEKLPFVAIAGATSVTAFWALHHAIHNLAPWSTVGLGPRLLQVAYSLVYYVWRTLWPSRLSYMIEYTWIPTLDQRQYPVAVAVVLLSALVIVLARRRWLTAAALAYAVAAFPQSGMFQNGPQLVANRYSYLAVLPIALLVGAGVAAASRWRPRVTAGAAGALVAASAVATLVHLPVWRDDTALQTYAAAHEPTCTGCQDWASVLAYERGDLRSAAVYIARAIPISATTLRPRYERYWSLGKVLDELGDRDDARAWLHVYLASVPVAWRAWPNEALHIRDAEARLARLEGGHDRL